MSLLYTKVLLWWDGARGQVQYDGIEWVLTHPPGALPEIREIDYCPELHAFELRPQQTDRKRDLEAPEIVAIKDWLERFGAVMSRRLRRRSARRAK